MMSSLSFGRLVERLFGKRFSNRRARRARSARLAKANRNRQDSPAENRQESFFEPLEPRVLMAATLLDLPDVNAPIFLGQNLLADGPAKGLSENLSSGDVNDQYIAPNGTGSAGSGSGPAGSGQTDLAVGMTDSIRIDTNAVDFGRSAAFNVATQSFDAVFSDGIQGINIAQPQALPSFDARAGLPNPDGINGLGEFLARAGMVTFYATNNPPSGFEQIPPAGSSTAQAFNLTPLRCLSTGNGGAVDDGLAPGSVAGDSNLDFMPFDAVEINGTAFSEP